MNVCLGMTKSKLYDPFFFAKNSVVGNIYPNIVELFLELQLQDNGILDIFVSQEHNGAALHIAHIVRDY